ncbi:MAG: AzlC family ABC transporter permease [Clostridia bacterium]
MNKAYLKGLRHGLPIALGYVSVAFAFGIQACGVGMTPLQTVMISFFNVTSAGQLAGLQLMASGAGLAEMALMQLTINLRYALMSLSLSQKLDSSMTLPHRLLISFCNTDEVFVVASQQPGKLGKAYLYGLTNGPFLGWVLGTALGALAGGILPADVTQALGIAIYGMFIAIVAPPFRRSREVRAVVLIAVGMSCAMTFLPLLGFVSEGFRIILCAVFASALGAWLMPRPVREEPIARGVKEELV